MHWSSLESHTVPAIQVRKLVRIHSLERSTPWLNGLVEATPHRGDGMEVQVLANHLVANTGSKQQGRRVQRAGGKDHRSCTDCHGVTLRRMGEDTRHLIAGYYESLGCAI